MTDYDQEDMEACRDLLRTKDGMDCLALHRSPVGRSILVYMLWFSRYSVV